MDKTLRLGVIGCGAVSEAYYLPVLKNHPDFQLTALVEKNVQQGHKIAALTGGIKIFRDYREILGRVDAVVIALPNALHAEVAIECLENGIHVFVEKPMAVSTAQCDRMIAAARTAKRVLAVGHSKRFFKLHRFVHQAFADGMFGDVVLVDVRDGCVFRWPVASVHYFHPEAACGLLLDIGAHVLDLLIWWLGEPRLIQYRDDAWGGIEADCELDIRFLNGCRGQVELSRTRDLRRTYIIETTRAVVEIDAGWVNPGMKVTNRSGFSLTGYMHEPGIPVPTYLDVMAEQLADFAAAVREQRDAFVTGKEARKCIALIEECYRNRRPLVQPWVSVGSRNDE